jgi:hypothetical protein
MTMLDAISNENWGHDGFRSIIPYSCQGDDGEAARHSGNGGLRTGVAKAAGCCANNHRKWASSLAGMEVLLLVDSIPGVPPRRERAKIAGPRRYPPPPFARGIRGRSHCCFRHPTVASSTNIDGDPPVSFAPSRGAAEGERLPAPNLARPNPIVRLSWGRKTTTLASPALHPDDRHRIRVRARGVEVQQAFEHPHKAMDGQSDFSLVASGPNLAEIERQRHDDRSLGSLDLWVPCIDRLSRETSSTIRCRGPSPDFELPSPFWP